MSRGRSQPFPNPKASPNPFYSSSSPAASRQRLVPNESTTSLVSSSPPSNAFLNVPSNASTRSPVQATNDARSLRSMASNSSFNTTTTHSLSDKFSLSPDPSVWALPSLNQQEPDDFLHNPDPRRDRKNDKGGTIFTSRGLANVGCLVVLVAGLVTLFAGYPLIIYFTKHPISNLGGFNIGGINASGQVPDMSGNWDLIDKETPNTAYTKTAFQAGVEMELVFSDEFNTDNRTFYPGDDPYWEAVDLHYWQTNNMEWYDPSSITTRNGALVITLSNTPNHGLDYMGGMIQTWNKFCFTGGRIEAAVTLPGNTIVQGLWPAVWTMGNLGRAGYGASLEGMWPYTYDSCDVGTLKNQTLNGGPPAALINGDPSANDVLSFLPGQRLSACTCSGESHPGPLKKDGSLTGRAAPEIDIFEAQIDTARSVGTVSQSAQWAPFDAAYEWQNTSANLQINNPETSVLNSYKGGAFQQATSVVSDTNQQCYSQSGTNCFAVYGFEYKPGIGSDSYITWINNNEPAWSLQAPGMGPNKLTQIGQRVVPVEPMYIIANLGMSTNFGHVDIKHLQFPVEMHIDWIRVYQPKGQKNIGCDPPDYPTSDYINTYIEAYTNPNLTTWVNDFGQSFPKNKLIDTCTPGT